MTMTRDDFQSRILPLKDKVFRLAFRYMRNEDEAKDVVQDVLLRFWENRASAATLRNPEAWLITMARNRCLDLLKRAGRNHEQVEQKYSLTDQAVTPDRLSERKELARKIREAIQSLPDQQARIMRLRDLEGYTYQEIADETGLELNVVKVNIHRARKSVKKVLETTYAYGNPE